METTDVRMHHYVNGSGAGNVGGSRLIRERLSAAVTSRQLKRAAAATSTSTSTSMSTSTIESIGNSVTSSPSMLASGNSFAGLLAIKTALPAGVQSAAGFLLRGPATPECISNGSVGLVQEQPLDFSKKKKKPKNKNELLNVDMADESSNDGHNLGNRQPEARTWTIKSEGSAGEDLTSNNRLPMCVRPEEPLDVIQDLRRTSSASSSSSSSSSTSSVSIDSSPMPLAFKSKPTLNVQQNIILQENRSPAFCHQRNSSNTSSSSSSSSVILNDLMMSKGGVSLQSQVPSKLAAVRPFKNYHHEDSIHDFYGHNNNNNHHHHQQQQQHHQQLQKMSFAEDVRVNGDINGQNGSSAVQLMDIDGRYSSDSYLEFRRQILSLHQQSIVNGGVGDKLTEYLPQNELDIQHGFTHQNNRNNVHNVHHRNGHLHHHPQPHPHHHHHHHLHNHNHNHHNHHNFGVVEKSSLSDQSLDVRNPSRTSSPNSSCSSLSPGILQAGGGGGGGVQVRASSHLSQDMGQLTTSTGSAGVAAVAAAAAAAIGQQAPSSINNNHNNNHGAANNSTSSTSSAEGVVGLNRRRAGRSLPDELKDEAYWERRRKNNEAAKRSRDARRAKEDEIAIRAAFLEQENLKLRVEVASLKSETTKLRCLLYNS